MLCFVLAISVPMSAYGITSEEVEARVSGVVQELARLQARAESLGSDEPIEAGAFRTMDQSAQPRARELRAIALSALEIINTLATQVRTMEVSGTTLSVMAGEQFLGLSPAYYERHMIKQSALKGAAVAAFAALIVSSSILAYSEWAWAAEHWLAFPSMSVMSSASLGFIIGERLGFQARSATEESAHQYKTKHFEALATVHPLLTARIIDLFSRKCDLRGVQMSALGINDALLGEYIATHGEGCRLFLAPAAAPPPTRVYMETEDSIVDPTKSDGTPPHKRRAGA